MNKFLIVLGVVVVILLGIYFFSSGGIGGSFTDTGTTNTSIKVGLNHTATAAVISAGDSKFYCKISNTGIGDVTLCYDDNCTFGSGILLTTSTYGSIYHEIDDDNPYEGNLSAVVSATTTPSTTSTLGVVCR